MMPSMHASTAFAIHCKFVSNSESFCSSLVPMVFHEPCVSPWAEGLHAFLCYVYDGSCTYVP